MTRDRTGLDDLATILARAYLRLAERSRRDAVSCVATEQNPLELSRPESPDHVVKAVTRRAS
jgi:hypothetical protein